MSIEICRTVVSVGNRVKRSSNKRVVFSVYLLATAMANVRLTAFTGIHDALMRGSKRFRPWGRERDECERNGGIVHIF